MFSKSWTFFIVVLFPFTLLADVVQEKSPSLEQRLEEVRDKHQRLKLLLELSDFYLREDPDKALSFVSEALSLSTQLGNKNMHALANIYSGVILREKGQLSQALQNFSEAKSVALELSLDSLNAEVMYQIGETFFELNNYEEALEQGLEQEEIWKKLGHGGKLSRTYDFIGTCYLRLGKIAMARTNISLALVMAKATQNPDLMKKPLFHMGDVFVRLNNPDTALSYLTQAREIAQKTNDRAMMSEVFNKQGRAFEELNQVELAEQSFLMSIQVAHKIKDLMLLRNCYKDIAAFYERQKDFEKALKYTQSFVSTEDSVIHNLINDKVSQLKFEYEVEKKTHQIQSLSQEAENNRVQLFLLSALLIVSTFLMFLFYNRYKLKIRSEHKIKVRNNEIVKQKDEISVQRALVEKKSKEIDNAIAYAQQIQHSLLPETPEFLNIFKNFFILNIPKDIISGDFYWFAHRDNNIMIIMADCTEHDVTGAFNTVVFNSLISQVITENYFMTPADLLKETNRRLIKMLHNKHGKNFNVWMDMGILSINVNSKRMVFAGAKIPLYILRGNNMIVLPAERTPIGRSDLPHISPFTNHTLVLKNEDKIYLLSDGYQNQFGGDENRKYLVKNLRNLLKSMADQPLEKQKELLHDTFVQWKGDQMQTDDILIFGLEV